VLAVYATGVAPEDPLSCLAVGEIEPPLTPEDWVDVHVRAASLNHHDVFALTGQALKAEQTPMILGTDAAGVTADGREVVVHAVLGDPAAGGGDETLDPRRTLLSERWPGALAEVVRVPARNLVDKPAELSFEDAACLPTAWLTAYRMIAHRSRTSPGETVLVQGAGGGVSTALIVLGKALGLRVWVTSRDEAKGAWAVSIGADAAFATGERLPEHVDAVLETVGAATWSHSLKALRPGGVVVVSGATSGANPPADLNRVFFLQLSVVGSTMGTIGELHELLELLARTGARPVVDSVVPMADARGAFAAMIDGEVRGKLVLVP
jgi:NADPH:quinone reductase-like Zn-dependent oxidoreductase